jgi:hypothetical protein
MKAKFERGQIMQINMYQRAWRSFAKQYPQLETAFDFMVECERINTDSDSIDDIPLRSWMNINIEMQQIINEALPQKRTVSDPELEERNKRAWLDEIRRTTPRNQFGIGLD